MRDEPSFYENGAHENGRAHEMGFHIVTMPRMQPWLVALTGIVAATIGTTLYSEINAAGSLTVDQVLDFVTTHWRALAVAWLTFYGAWILLLSSIAAFSGCRNVPHIWSAREWAVAFHYRLAATQYFTCVIFLFLLAIPRLPFQSESPPGDISVTEIALRFMPCAALALAGLVIWSMCCAIVLFRIPATTQPSVRAPEPGLLEQEVVGELQKLADLIQHHRPLAEKMDATVAAVSDVLWAVHQDLKVLLDRRASPIADDLAEAQSALDRSAADLRATVSMLQESVRQLVEINGSLGQADHLRRSPSIARSELSRELKKLLEEMPPR